MQRDLTSGLRLVRVFEKGYFIVVAVLFCAASLAKVIGLATGTIDGHKDDVLFVGIPQVVSLGLASFLELAVARVLFLSSDAIAKHALVMWLSMVFLSYRFGIWLTGVNYLCPCFGGIYKLLQVPAAWTDSFAVFLLVFCFWTSGVLAVWTCHLSKPGARDNPEAALKRPFR
jgi:hypothetical protein